jgi:protein-disulfide isomerase
VRVLTLLAASTAFAWSQAPAPNAVVATVNGVAIRESDLHVESQLTALRQQEFEIKRQALQAALGRKLLDAAAQARGVTVEQFFSQEVEQKIGEPKADELEAVYSAQRERFQKPLAEVRDQVRDAWREMRIKALRQALAERLLGGADIQILIQPPRYQVDLGNAPRRGPSQAPVTIVEFSDYQCPYCKRAQATLSQLATKYGDRVAFVYKDFPLEEIHPQARPAAEAAHCAEEQGKFWAYHDALFAASPDFAGDMLQNTAEHNGLDLKAFGACVDAHKYRERVDRESEQGQSLGVNGTPAFFVNGLGLFGAVPLSEFERLIDAELGKK